VHSMGLGIHHCYCRLNEQFRNALDCRATSRVQYSPWFVLSFFTDGGAVLLEHSSHPDLVIGSDGLREG